MGTLNFSDGIKVSTDGPLRKLRLSDGLYIVGEGMMIPVDDIQEADELIRKIKNERRTSNEKTEFWR